MSDGFVIRLDEVSALQSTRAVPVAMPGFVDMEAASSLYQQILKKALELLAANLPPWGVVETAIRAAYDLYIRPLSIPNFIDNRICDALVAEIKQFYQSL